jgi:hypothetical protein
MILIALQPADGLISRYECVTGGKLRLTHRAEAPEHPYTFQTAEVELMRVNPPQEYERK